MVHVLCDLKHGVPAFPSLPAAPESTPHNPHNNSSSASDRRSLALDEQIDYNFPNPALASDGPTPVQIAPNHFPADAVPRLRGRAADANFDSDKFHNSINISSYDDFFHNSYKATQRPAANAPLPNKGADDVEYQRMKDFLL